MYKIEERVPVFKHDDREIAKRDKTFFNCRCCDKSDGALYMVPNEVWEIANIHKFAGIVCVECLDVRLQFYRGDGLLLNDLNKHAVNRPILYALKKFGASACQADPPDVQHCSGSIQDFTVEGYYRPCNATINQSGILIDGCQEPCSFKKKLRS